MAVVFVYGTLRAGGPNHSLLSGLLACTQPAWLDDHVLHGHGLPFPYVTPARGWRVRGELCWPEPASADELLATLDRLEGFDDDPANHYERVERACRTEDGAVVAAFVYLAGPRARARLAVGPDRRVAGGDWFTASVGGG